MIRPGAGLLALWHIRALSVSAVLIALAVSLALDRLAAGVFAGIAFTIVYGYAGFIFIPRFFSRYRLVVGEDGLTLVTGVFISIERHVDYGDIVAHSLFSTPLMRLFGLSTLIITTPSSTVRVQGVPLTASRAGGVRAVVGR